MKVGDRVRIPGEENALGVITYVDMGGGEVEVELDAGPRVSYMPSQVDVLATELMDSVDPQERRAAAQRMLASYMNDPSALSPEEVVLLQDLVAQAEPAPSTIDIPARSVITGYQKDRLRHALNVASREMRANADDLERAAALAKTQEDRAGDKGTDAFMTSAGALGMAKDYRTYAAEMDALIEHLDGTVFIAFVEEED